jgi:hypothetical protein
MNVGERLMRYLDLIISILSYFSTPIPFSPIPDVPSHLLFIPAPLLLQPPLPRNPNTLQTRQYPAPNRRHQRHSRSGRPPTSLRLRLSSRTSPHPGRTSSGGGETEEGGRRCEGVEHADDAVAPDGFAGRREMDRAGWIGAGW